MVTNVLNNNTIEFKLGEVVYFVKENSSTEFTIKKTYVAEKIVTESKNGVETVFLFSNQPYVYGQSICNSMFKEYQFVYTEETLNLLLDKLRNIAVNNF